MNQIQVSDYPCKYHNEYRLEFICVAENCYYASDQSNKLIDQTENDECQSRIACKKCIEDHHSFYCGNNCYLQIKQPFKMPKYFDTICQQVSDIYDEKQNLINMIETQFEQLKIKFLNRIEAEKKNIIRDITEINADIIDYNYKLQKKWNFSQQFYSWLSQINCEDLQNKHTFSHSIEENIQKCHQLTKKLGEQYKKSSTSFQLFSNIDKQIEEINQKINNLFNDFDVKRRNELSKCQEFKFITNHRNINLNPDQDGYQIIRNQYQSYFDCFTSEDLQPNKTYQILFAFDKIPSNSVTVGLVNSEGIRNPRVEKKVSQSLVNSYNKFMGNIVKGQALYSAIKENQIYKVKINLNDNIFNISDEEEQNMISVDEDYILIKGLKINSQEWFKFKENKNLYSDVNWRFFFSFNEPIINVKIIKAIKY